MRFILPLLLLPTLASRSANAETLVLRGAAQGTSYHIKFVRPSTDFDTQKLQVDIDRLLGEIDQQMSTYREDSEISRFNRAPAGEWFDVSPAVVNVVIAARAISEKSDGAMDITVGPLLRLWHFGPKGNGKVNAMAKFEPPSDEKIRDARKRVGYKQLAVLE
jgi:thiamine biosynthesis lipoprotein